jgi:hypothetical protein
MQITITNEDIEYAEKILLPANKHFDEERRNFITNLDTIDLQAVPGSGKTTALLAKLIILEKKMPFPDGSGVLILSHTNTAVEEIQSKLQTIAPKLFNFPNFVGTIQSFTDTFLALPYYAHVYKTHPYRIDDDLFAYLIYKLQNEGKLPMTGSYAAVGWRKSILNGAADDKLGISDYYDSFCTAAASTKINYSSLTDHLLAVDPHKKHLETIRKSILNALLHILYMQKIQDKHGRYYTIRTLFKYLKEETDIYELFKRNLFRWCKQQINNEPIEQTIHDIQAFLPDFLQAVSLDNNPININNDTYSFITTPVNIIQNNKTVDTKQINICSISGIDISIKTVHAIKGQTVTGLLYMETYNSSMHESNRLVDCFIHKKFRKTTKTKKSGMMYKATKTVYVGFSRPTHLLCFAVQKERFDKHLTQIDRELWDIIEI